MRNEQEIQPTETIAGQSSLPGPVDIERLRLSAHYFAYTSVPSTLSCLAMGGQWGSFVVGGLLGVTAGYFAPTIHGTIAPGIHVARQIAAYMGRNNSGRTANKLLDKNWWMTGEQSVQYAEDEEKEEMIPEAGEQQAVNGERKQEDTLSLIPPQFVLGSSTLAAIKEVNSKRFVYFGRSASKQVVLHIDEMYHVLDVAKSGRGKSNRFRNAMMQVVGLADTYYLNPFAAPVKSVADERKIEVWQPIYDRLAELPARESADILRVLTSLVDEIKKRSDQEQLRDFSWREHPIFVFIDEVPEIYARCPEAVDLLDRIGRGGRQFGIFAWVATQTALVKDIGLSTASQAQFKTLLYGGGDKTSGARVMGVITVDQEKALKANGAGLILMIADGVEDTEYVRAPLVTNEALFAYLGLPPFQMSEWVAPVRPSVQRGVLSRSPVDGNHRAQIGRERETGERGEIPVKALDRLGETGETQKDAGERFTVSHEEEIAVLNAAFQVQQSGSPVTREAIKLKLGWNNKKHEIVKSVCDKHKIAIR